MKYVLELCFSAISNSKLASQTKNITNEWNDIAAICVGNPVIVSIAIS